MLRVLLSGHPDVFSIVRRRALSLHFILLGTNMLPSLQSVLVSTDVDFPRGMDELLGESILPTPGDMIRATCRLYLHPVSCV